MKNQPEITMATKEKIVNSFWNLYCEKGIQHISVSQVVKNAGVNRSTFYQYFCDIYNLLENIEDSLLDNLAHELEVLINNGFPSSLKELSKKSVSIIEKHGDTLFHLLGSNGDPSFSKKLKTAAVPYFVRIIGIDENLPNIDYIINFAISSLITLLTYWYESDKNLPIEELINLIQTLISTGVLGFTNKKLFKEQL